MNGWTKMARPLLRDPPRIEGGAILLEPGWTPRLDEAALAAATRDYRASK